MVPEYNHRPVQQKGAIQEPHKENEKRKTKSNKEHASYKDTHEAKGESQDQIKCASNEHGHMPRSYAPPLSLDGAGV